jgi:signal transduction histidine kinase
MTSPRTPDARWRHDLKNQLGIVLGFAELLLQDLDEKHPLRADIEEILKAGERAMALVEAVEDSDSDVNG